MSGMDLRQGVLIAERVERVKRTVEFGYPEALSRLPEGGKIHGLTVMLLVDLLHWAGGDGKDDLRLDEAVSFARKCYEREAAPQ